MQNLILYNSDKLNLELKPRKGETKFGEHVQLITNFNNIYDDIYNLDVDYVIFGISEDIGVIANYGKPGTYKAWDTSIEYLLNTQSNDFINAKRILILGHLDYSEKLLNLKSEELSAEERIKLAQKYTEDIDVSVSQLVEYIVKANKTPIIIGGGHNNAYGNIKGTSMALDAPINAINFDAHHDFRALEGRHSGNGFNYAYQEGYLKNYYVFGLHENYISEDDLKRINNSKTVSYTTYEAIEIRGDISFPKALQSASEYVMDSQFGIEIDCDAIENVPSSALTPSGFSTKQARQFTHTVGSLEQATYLHICEAAPTPKTKSQVGKLISYLITDFIKAHGYKHH